MNIKTGFNRVLILLVMLVTSFQVRAAFDFEACSVNEIVIANGDINAHVQLTCKIENLPACATAKTYFAFDRSTESGKQRLAVITAAFAANMKLTGLINKGENTCPAWQTNVALLTHLRVKK